MQVLRDASLLPSECYGAVAALGNFDGLHLGHQAVIGKAVTMAGEMGKPAMVITFEPHPRRVFRPNLPVLRILLLAEKIRRMRELGVDFLRIVRFTRAFSQTPAEDFVTHMLHEELHLAHAITGEDFTFGYQRGGNAQVLSGMAKALGFSATICPQITAQGVRCSSTRIREALAVGEVEEAATLLGRPYRIAGRVRHGDKRGRELGFPTANLLPPPIFLPKFGIYAVRVKVGGKRVHGVASLGVRPNYPLKTPLLEVCLFDWKEEIYGERMEVELVRYLRPELKFDGVEALKAQMAEDYQQAKAILG